MACVVITPVRPHIVFRSLHDLSRQQVPTCSLMAATTAHKHIYASTTPSPSPKRSSPVPLLQSAAASVTRSSTCQALLLYTPKRNSSHLNYAGIRMRLLRHSSDSLADRILTLHRRHFSSRPNPKEDVSTAYNDVIRGDITPKGNTYSSSALGDEYSRVVKGADGVHNEQFNDHQLAYASKTTWELARTAFFFFLFRFRFVTENTEAILNGINKVLGKRLSDFLIKRLIYDQFVGGATDAEVQAAVSRLQKEGVGPLNAVPIEDDLGHGGGGISPSKEEVLDANLTQILNCMDLCLQVSRSDPMFQLRITALFSPQLTKSLSQLCEANTTDPHSMSVSVVEVLVSAMKGGRLEDLAQTKEWENFSATDIAELETALRRVQTINKKILQTAILAMVDAEYTYFNQAIRHVTYAMMEVCNGRRPLVFYTYQAYLKSTYPILKSDMGLAKSRGVCFGAKLVRGAYILKERHLAQAGGYPDPVNETFETTSEKYHLCLERLLAEACEDQDRIRFIVASHNEDSIRFALTRMNSLGLPLDSKSVLFGQLYGMADHVSYTLGKRGVNVVKSIPYGTVDDTIPYLSRRAQENRSILDNVRKERQLVKTALRDRLLLRRNISS